MSGCDVRLLNLDCKLKNIQIHLLIATVKIKEGSNIFPAPKIVPKAYQDGGRGQKKPNKKTQIPVCALGTAL